LRVNHLFEKKKHTQTWQNSAPDVPTFLNERCPFSTVAGPGHVSLMAEAWLGTGKLGKKGEGKINRLKG